MTEKEKADGRIAASELLKAARVVITPEELASMEIVDFGLADFTREGLAIVVCANTDRYCGKELILLPNQICPEHRHPPVALANGQTDPGKMETFRCRWGTAQLYVEGEPPGAALSGVPKNSASSYTVGRKIDLKPGGQYTIPPNVRHWFQAGKDGAVITEFSSTSRDEFDVFTDARIRRVENP